MLKEKVLDSIVLVWKDPSTRRNFEIGELKKFQNGFSFNYIDSVKEAQKSGFKLMVGFENPDKVYYNDILFPIFSSRLPDKRRKDMKNILERFGLKEFDEFEMLKKSNSRLPIDTMYFIEPIYEADMKQKIIERKFYIAGQRHYLECKGDNCVKFDSLEVGDELNIQPEPENEYDENAIKLKYNKKKIGYIPRYYVKQIKELLDENYNVNIKVLKINKRSYCEECVEVLMVISKN